MNNQLELCIELANQGDAEASYQLGYHYLKNWNCDALLWTTKAAENDHNNAKILLGWIYKEGKFTQPNYIKAIFWYEKAVKQQDNAEVQYILGKLYQKGGWGLRKNNKKSYLRIKKSS